MKFSDLVERLGVIEASSLTQFPDWNPDLVGVAAIQAADVGTLSYIEGAKFAGAVVNTQASALILPLDEELQQRASERQIAWISVREPRLEFARAIALFYQPFRLPSGIHPTAVIDPSVKLGKAVAIGAYVVIHADSSLGDDVCIHANAVLYPGVTIGDRTTLHANCVIHERTQIGADCVVHSGAVIGAEGFGFVPTAQGWEKMEQSGVTILEDGVEIGCNTSVDRPAVGETRIRCQTKLDNLIQVGHNSDIGEACALASQVGLAGGVKVGNRVILSGQVGVANQTQIGDRAQAGAKAGLHSNVEPGSIMMGSPATDYRTFLKASAIYNRLPEMHRSLRQLQRQIEDLQQQLSALQSQSEKTP